MSQQNVEIVRQAYESFERRDWDGMLDLFDPNVEQHGTIGGVEEGNVARGIREVREIWQKEDDEIWDEHRLEPQEFIDAGDQVVVFQREYQRGKSSGVELVVDTASILEVRGGRIVRMQGYMDRGAALRAAGLSGNAEIVRRHLEETNARRFDAAMRSYDPSVVLVVSEEVAVDPGTYRGADAVGEWFGSWFGTFAPDYRLDVAELIPVDDRVVVAVDHRGVGRRSGVEVTTRYYNAYWIRQDKIVRLELFRERSEALRAVGLSGEDAHAGS